MVSKLLLTILAYPLGQFESGTQVEFPDGRVADSFVLCDEIINADAVIKMSVR